MALAAGIAFITDFAVQASQNSRQGMDFWRSTASENIDWAEAAGATVAGGTGALLAVAALPVAPTLVGGNVLGTIGVGGLAQGGAAVVGAMAGDVVEESVYRAQGVESPTFQYDSVTDWLSSYGDEAVLGTGLGMLSQGASVAFAGAASIFILKLWHRRILHTRGWLMRRCISSLPKAIVPLCQILSCLSKCSALGYYLQGRQCPSSSESWLERIPS